MSRQESLILTRKNWGEAVLPGTELVLSILITCVALDSHLQCPLCERKLDKTPISWTRLWYVVSLLPADSFLMDSSRLMAMLEGLAFFRLLWNNDRITKVPLHRGVLWWSTEGCRCGCAVYHFLGCLEGTDIENLRPKFA